MSTLATLLEARAALQDSTGGQHPALAKLDRLIAVHMKVRVYVLSNSTDVSALADVMGDDEGELSHILDQLTKGNLATGGGGASAQYVVERASQ